MSASPVSTMRTVDVNGTQLAYRDDGSSGAPIVFIHGGLVADAWLPVVTTTDLAKSFRLISYHRRGYGESTHDLQPISTEQQAADCLALIRTLGIPRAHVAGYSYGGSIALQLALDAPDAVLSLALFEPLIPAAMADPATVQFFMDTAQRAFGMYAAGDKAAAIDTFAQGAFGPDYKPVLEAALLGGFERMVSDSDALFRVEMAAIQQWAFGPSEARRISVPILAAYHEEARWAGFSQTHAAVTSWFPQVQEVKLMSRTHLLQMERPLEAAAAISCVAAGRPIQ